MGFTQFHLRGIEKVTVEWQLIALAYNCKRLWNLSRAQKGGGKPRKKSKMLSKP